MAPQCIENRNRFYSRIQSAVNIIDRILLVGRTQCRLGTVIQIDPETVWNNHIINIHAAVQLCADRIQHGSISICILLAEIVEFKTHSVRHIHSSHGFRNIMNSSRPLSGLAAGVFGRGGRRNCITPLLRRSCYPFFS